ncbi:UNVERIFIED_CONTAM: hypothetical protein Sangu_2004400 [Sesamum angustifolium]|uniref:Uncharacterized protein n=1 Tax=Sesamum angustifolium TaxID=2727405 RepID=A0AAW2LGL9_9LAMI
MKNPLNWPPKVIAANSMYRISRTVLLTHRAENDETDEQLFDQLSIMIADIMAACLTNLPQVITMKCHRNAIEEREKSVCKAALLLGETEEILALLQQRELPILDPDRAAYIEEWRALMKQVNRIIRALFVGLTLKQMLRQPGKSKQLQKRTDDCNDKSKKADGIMIVSNHFVLSMFNQILYRLP